MDNLMNLLLELVSNVASMILYLLQVYNKRFVHYIVVVCRLYSNKAIVSLWYKRLKLS